MKKHIITIIFILSAVLLLSFSGCKGEADSDSTKKQDGYTDMNIQYETRADGSSYCLYNGEAQEFFGVGEGSENTVDVTVKRESGVLRITIHEENNPDNVVYEGQDFPGEHFTVKVSEPGRYRILVHAEDFIGEYNFSYDMWQ